MGGLSNPQRDSAGRKRPGLASLADKRWVLRLLFWAAIVVVGSAVVIIGAYYFDVATESRYFCGVLCHPNNPQYVAQEVSPHADLECGTCHVGPGLLPKVQAKIAGVKELYLQVTNLYERPIEHPVSQLKTADVICEQCHTASHTYADRIVRIARFAEDEPNTRTQIDLAVRIGAGTEMRGVSAAHWHIAHPVSYITRDVYKQDIPWAAVMGGDGEWIEYETVDNPLTAEERASLTQREMDCLDCHNRATHAFRNPDRWVDELMASGRIDSDLPFVKREAMALLSRPYETQEAGLAAMDGLLQFYQSEYPSLYAEQEGAVKEAVAALQEIYAHTTFPRMNLTWDFYPDNLGHTDFPGCFRCHDGAHLNAQDEPIASNCTLCHSAPLVADEDGRVESSTLRNAVLAVQKPDSHRAPDFIWEHRLLAEEPCADCHGTIAFGTDNSSFCANGICHGLEWPAPAQYADFSHPVQLVGGHAGALCSGCHAVADEPLTEDCVACHQPPSEPHFGDDCAGCHNPFGWQRSAAAWTATVSDVPHRVELAPSADGAIDCLSCHVNQRVTTIPASHEPFPADSCLACHEVTFIAGSHPVPHIVEGRGRCLTCHGEDKLVPRPPSHEGWTNDFCLLCHDGA
jgi:nitrate/TMAO reductase-like tetraheme cytochrome c subunit